MASVAESYSVVRGKSRHSRLNSACITKAADDWNASTSPRCKNSPRLLRDAGCSASVQCETGRTENAHALRSTPATAALQAGHFVGVTCVHVGWRRANHCGSRADWTRIDGNETRNFTAPGREAETGSRRAQARECSAGSLWRSRRGVEYARRPGSRRACDSPHCHAGQAGLSTDRRIQAKSVWPRSHLDGRSQISWPRR